ncbi:high-potential iron-sulfur protein [Leeia sp. TBRC 13508]|uniref:High-potential iron-sulfur protein n=1 Tax=Leeia speluncae TaxID=2884804 RepID=A0ABS8D9Y2_9NEIS|nr:high-potential iron-sulfur protein [Leeia speluncae]MCB6184736.1 high-potential iron-sulfur protein [Leeia speluncae]
MDRRTFMLKVVPATGLALAAGKVAFAADLTEADPQATALGYKADATKVDKKKFPKYAAGQNCGTCQLFAKAGAASAPCPIFGGKNVAAKGWCSAYAKKA